MKPETPKLAMAVQSFLRENAWKPGYYAHNSQGRLTRWDDPDAVAYSLSGAMRKVLTTPEQYNLLFSHLKAIANNEGYEMPAQGGD